MTLINKIEYLLSEKGKNKRQMSIEADLPYNTIRNFWIQGVDKMQLPTFRKLCDYFNVTMDSMAYDDREIEYRTAKPERALSPAQQEVVEAYGHADDRTQRIVEVTLGLDFEHENEGKSSRSRVATGSTERMTA